MQDWKLGDLNKSKAFISPMLGLNKDGTIRKNSYLDFYDGTSLATRNFRNCFIGDDVVNIDDKVLMLYKFSAKQEFIAFEEWIQDHSLYLDQYDPDKSHVMYIFDIPDIVKEDYFKIKEGKYSLVSDFYKKHILKFLGLDKLAVGHKENHIGNALERHEEGYLYFELKYDTKIPRDMEVVSKFIKEQEYYQEKYKETEALKPNMDL